MTQDEMKKAVAEAAVEYIKPKLNKESIVGVGTGSTANFFIDALAEIKHMFDGAVASSEATAERLRAQGIEVFDLNAVSEMDVYVDGADEFDSGLNLVKGAKEFVCIVDSTKKVGVLGAFPLPVEVIPMARSYVAREIVKLDGMPEWREGFVTDNGNLILDVHDMEIMHAKALETQLNNIVGVVTNGLFANRGADVVLMGTPDGVETIAL